MITKIKKTQENNYFYLFLIFLTCFTYWIFLFNTVQTQIIFDAQSYENLGKIISSQGWEAFFKNGVNREPLYPALIALSMKLANQLNCNYIKIIYIFQFLTLFITQLLTLLLLNQLKVRRWVCYLTIIYIGFSPGLVNSTLSLFSEIISYPFILCLVWLSAKLWVHKFSSPIKELFFQSIIFSVLFLVITFTKAIFTYIYFLFIFPFIILSVYKLIKKQYLAFIKIIVFLCISISLFMIPIHLYKSLNLKYNGVYALSDRAWILYGNTDRRTRAMPVSQKLAALATIPGDNVCDSLFKKEECFYWKIITADGFSHNKYTELGRQNYNLSNIDQKARRDAFELIKHNPLQYSFFYFIDALKIFFWESTQIGTVTYPPLLEKIFNNLFIKNGLRLIISILSFIGFISALRFLFRNRKLILHAPDPKTCIILSCTIMILSFTALYAIIQIIPRYVFTIAPLFLILMGFLGERILINKEKT